MNDKLPPIEKVPSAHLEGRSLGNGWRVNTRVHKEPGATGGHYSISYNVQHKDGRRAFLKALNFYAAVTGEGEFVDLIGRFLDAYRFEVYIPIIVAKIQT